MSFQNLMLALMATKCKARLLAEGALPGVVSSECHNDVMIVHEVFWILTKSAIISCQHISGLTFRKATSNLELWK